MTEKHIRPQITYQQRHVHCHIMDSASVTADILTSQSRKSTGVTHHINDDSVTLSVPVSQHAQHQGPGTKAPKYNIPKIPILNLPCVFHLL